MLLKLLVLVIWANYVQCQIIYQYNFHTADSLSGWSTSASAKLVPGLNGNLALSVTVPPRNPPGAASISRSLPDFGQYAGYILYCQVLLKIENVTQPQQPWNGVKIMVVTEDTDGQNNYFNTNGVYGTFGWTDSEYLYTFAVDTTADSAVLVVGLQDSAGTIWVDNINITVFRAPPKPLPPPPVNPPPPYNGHPNVPRYRGVMSPQTYVDSDMQNLGQNWKANLMRWQMNAGGQEYGWSWPQYEAWLEAKLNETDHLLAACVKYGIKVVVDLHSTPGGLDPEYGNLILVNSTWQAYFLQVWNEIAVRYKGNEAVWGYDLANEPNQFLPGEPGVLGWQELADETARVIRKIDTEVTIIVESEFGGGPTGYQWLRPISDNKTVYEVHMYSPYQFTFQGVMSGVPTGPVYPGVIAGTYTNISTLKQILQPVRDFQLAFNVQIYDGEFSAARWAANATAVNWIGDCIKIFEEYGWDWTYHAYREWEGWSVEYDENINDNYPVNYTTSRKKLLLDYFAQNTFPYPLF